MTVIPSGLFDDSNPYSETFTIANIGFLPFEEVHVGMGFCSIKTAKDDFRVSEGNCDATGPHFLFGSLLWQAPELKRDEPWSIVLTDTLNIATEKYRREHPGVVWSTQMMSPLTAANMIFVVSFKPWPWFRPIRYRYRFVAEEQSNGKMMWRGVPLAWTKIELPK